jgi:hypothetical protein
MPFPTLLTFSFETGCLLVRIVVPSPNVRLMRKPDKWVLKPRCPVIRLIRSWHSA